MKFALIAIYIMAGLGTVIGLEKAQGTDLGNGEKVFMIACWPIGVTALTAYNLVKVSKK